MQKPRWFCAGWWRQKWYFVSCWPWSRKKRAEEMQYAHEMLNAECAYRAQQNRENDHPYIITPLLLKICRRLLFVERLLFVLIGLGFALLFIH